MLSFTLSKTKFGLNEQLLHEPRRSSDYAVELFCSAKVSLEIISISLKQNISIKTLSIFNGQKYDHINSVSLVFDITHDTICDMIGCDYHLLDALIYASAALMYHIAVRRWQHFHPSWDCQYRAHRCKLCNKRGVLIINAGDMLVFQTQRTD